MRSWSLGLILLVASCSSEPIEVRGEVRDFQTMLHAKYEHRACGSDADCPFGTGCDGDACTYECTADDACGDGLVCSDYGHCVLGVRPFVAIGDPACAGISDADKLAKLVHIFNHDAAGTLSCHDDAMCPCGSFCDEGARECAVECSNLPNSTLTCDDAQATCDPLGHCTTAIDPAPTIQLALALSPSSVSGDTFAHEVTATVDASVDALDVAFRVNPHRAKVIYTLVDIDGVVPPPDPATVPQIKCAASEPFASRCALDGGWTFDLASDSVHSATRAITVRLPRTATRQTWTLQATSDWAASPTTTTLRADPVLPPPSVAGHYTGKLTLTNPIGTSISASVDAVITDTNLALVDRSSTVIPDGHADFSRGAAKVTVVRWLTSTIGTTTTSYNATIALGALTQDPATGRITAAGTLAAGPGMASTIDLALDRVRDLAPACTSDSQCPAHDADHPENDTYCDTVVSRCIVGHGPAGGAGIVDAGSQAATPSLTLPSPTFAAWQASAQQLRQDPTFGGHGYAGVVHAYCSRSGEPAYLDRMSPLAPVSRDAQCTPGGGPHHLQDMFPFVDKQRELEPGLAGQNDIVLQDDCNAELAESPSASVPAKKCVSVARFVAALEADVDGGAPGTGSDAQRSLIAQILRQWLGLHTYLTGTAVQAQDLHDAVADDQVSRQLRLARAADAAEQGLGILLDPAVRAQFTSGTQIARITRAPDDRVPARPVARWTFNGSTADAEGSNAMVLSSGTSLANNALLASGAGGSCHTSAPVALGDRSFSISAVLRYVPWNGQTVTLVEKHAANGEWLRLDASTVNRGATVTLTLHDSNNRAATFEIPWLPGNWSDSVSILAVVADEGSYRTYVANNDVNHTVEAANVTGGGPRWGAAGIVDLACQTPGAATCTSVDRVVPGDSADLGEQAKSVQYTDENQYTCYDWDGDLQCWGLHYGYAPGICAQEGTTTLTALQAQARSTGAPESAVAKISVTSEPNIVDVGQTDDPFSSWFYWDCKVTTEHVPTASTGLKPVCGQGDVFTEWDEVALWDHPVTRDEFDAMVTRYGFDWQRLHQTVADSPHPAGDEQKAGLPVYLLAAIDADLRLVASYLAAEDDLVYGDCYKGKSSPELPVAVDRAARHLRLAAVLESEAAALAALADPAASWKPRYAAALQALGARHDAVLQKLRSLFACTNSLGITDGEVPVYAGGSSSLDPKARFFAGSMFLVAKARDAIWGPNGAQTVLATARAHFNAARASQFDFDRAGTTEKQDRIRALTASAEDQLRRFCGTRPGDSQHPFPLYDAFAAGTITAASCYLKRELPACAALPPPTALTFGAIPDACLRGQIGERIIAIKSAVKDQENAKRAADRATALWDDQTKYCAETVAGTAAQLAALLAAHQNALKKIRDRLDDVNLIGGILKGAESIAVAAATGGASDVAKSYGNKTRGEATTEASITSALDLGLTLFQQHYQSKLQAENDAYELQVLAAQGNANLAACTHAADQMRPAADAAMDASDRAALEAQAALFAVGDDMNAVAGIVQAGQAQIALENTIDRTPPQLHYWLDEDIANYAKQLAYARRLTYLAVRAFDYEAQRDSNKRGRVLAARTPLELDAVLNEIDALQGGASFNQSSLDLQPLFPTFTLSLRDEILNFHPAQGTDPGVAFGKLVLSDEHRVFVTGHDGRQHLLGHGIPFSLNPNQGWNNVLCDERSWRITLRPEITNRNDNLSQPFVLFQTNAFSSQTCRQEPGTITTTRVRQKLNLFTNDDPTTFEVADPYFNAPMTIPSSGFDKNILAALPPESSLLDGSFAGRGVYGDYILVFPTCDGVPGCTDQNGYTEANLAKLRDVTIRIDMSAANNVPNSPSN